MDIMPKLREVIREGLDLETPVDKKPFRVIIDKEGIRLIVGPKKNSRIIKGDSLNSLVLFLQNRDWITIRTVHNYYPPPNTLESHSEELGIDIGYLNYIVVVLEYGGFIEIDRNAPTKVQISHQQ